MKPYYQDDLTTIYHGDCCEVLSGLNEGDVKAVVTDPPFSSGTRQDASKPMRGAMLRGAKWENEWFSHDNLATVGFLFLMRMVSVQLLRVTCNGGSLQMFIDWRMYPNLYGVLESSAWMVKNLVVWDKVNFGMGSNYRNQHEFIVYAEKPGGNGQVRRRDIGNVLSFPRTRATFHPTEKPVPLLERIIDVVAGPGDVVIDPFCGSGSTLVAASNLRCLSIGIEINEQFCEGAARRLEQRSLFPMPCDAPKLPSETQLELYP